jgi:hypothetical protein
MRSIWIYLACGAALASASAAYAALAAGDKSQPSIASAAASNQPRVKIAGRVEYLYPGGHVRLQLTLRNRSSQPVMVRAVTATVRDASLDCGSTNLNIPPRRHLKLEIRPHKRRGVAMTATLAGSAPGSCRNATFPLQYKARVKR